MNHIYYIKNIVNSKYYIGLTNNPKRRETRHFSDLRNGKHDNIHLQNSFNKYGESSFEFKVIYKKDCTLEHISDMEKEFIKKYNSYQDGYNMNEGGFENNGFVSQFSKCDVFNILASLKYVSMSGELLAEIHGTTRTSINRVKYGEICEKYKTEFDNFDEQMQEDIFINFDKKHNIINSVNSRLGERNKKFPEDVYLCILAYNEKHKRKSPIMANILNCCPSTIRLFIRGKTNKYIHEIYNSLDDNNKENFYSKAKNLFENNASLCGNT